MKHWILMYDIRCVGCEDQAKVMALAPYDKLIPLCSKCFWVAMKYKRIIAPAITCDVNIMGGFFKDVYEPKDESLERRQEHYKNAILGDQSETYTPEEKIYRIKERERLKKREQLIEEWKKEYDPERDRIERENLVQKYKRIIEEHRRTKRNLVIAIAVLSVLLIWAVIFILIGGI